MIELAWSAHVSMLFSELPLLARPAAARDAGFSLIESWWPGQAADAWCQAVRKAGVSVALVNADGGDLDAGERGFLNVPGRRREVVSVFCEAVELAKRCGAPRINVLVGRETHGSAREDQLATATAALVECAAIAREAELTILVEPINELDVPGYLVPTPAAAVTLIESVGSDSVRLLYDAYHAARAGGNPCQEVASFIPMIGHVHYADCPGRGAPGTGELDLRAFAEALENAGYTGAIGLEFNPGNSTRDALRFLQTW